MIASLLVLSLVPPWFNRRIDGIRQEIERVVEPARVQAREQLDAVVREITATRAYLLGGDPALLERARDERRNAEEAAERAAAAMRPLGPEVLELHGRLSAAASRWRERQDALLAGELSARAYLAELPEQQARFEALFEEAASLDEALAAEAVERRTSIRRAARRLSVVVALLGASAMVASMVVAWLARRERAFARSAENARARAERHAKEERTLKEVMRALGASVSFREVVEKAAERSVELTRAFGAYVEKFDVPEPGSEVEIVAVAGKGVPALGTRVPYPGSLSEELMESHAPQVMTEVGAIGERMAPYLTASCPGCTGLIVPLSSGGEILGTLVLLRRAEQGAYTVEEVELARALGDAASAALRRVLLLEDVEREKRARDALLESTDEGILGIDGAGCFTLVNRAASLMLGWDPAEMLGRSVHPLIHHHRPGGVAYAEEECPLTHVIRGGAGVRSESDLLWRKDGSSFPAEFSVRPIAEGGVTVGAVIAFTDITERKQNEQERERLHEMERRARAEAETALRARDELLSAVSHDLRNPLGTIRLSADFLLRQLGTGDERASERRKVEVIGRASESMDHMIQDLLDVDRIDSGRLVLELAPTDPAAVVEETCALFRPHAERAGISLSCSASPELPQVLADAGGLQRILSNLLGNALKFTPEGGAVSVQASAAADGVSFAVTDTGRGIAAEELPRLFDRHWQASRTDRRGLGLGLAIVKGLIEAHGGAIHVESTPGRGSTFRVAIPIATRPG